MTAPIRNFDPEYRFETATGQLFFRSSRTEIIVGDIDLAITWTTDEDGNGCLHKHGIKENVEARAALIRSVDETVKTVVIPWEAISHPEAGQKIIEEVNMCLAVSGRISKIEGFLQDLSEKYDVEVFPRDTPSSSMSMKP